MRVSFKVSLFLAAFYFLSMYEAKAQVYVPSLVVTSYHRLLDSLQYKSYPEIESKLKDMGWSLDTTRLFDAYRFVYRGCKNCSTEMEESYYIIISIQRFGGEETGWCVPTGIRFFTYEMNLGKFIGEELLRQGYIVKQNNSNENATDIILCKEERFYIKATVFNMPINNKNIYIYDLLRINDN